MGGELWSPDSCHGLRLVACVLTRPLGTAFRPLLLRLASPSKGKGVPTQQECPGGRMARGQHPRDQQGQKALLWAFSRNTASAWSARKSSHTRRTSPRYNVICSRRGSAKQRKMTCAAW